MSPRNYRNDLINQSLKAKISKQFQQEFDRNVEKDATLVSKKRKNDYI